MFVDAELDTGMKLDATVWRLDLDCAQREPRREAQGVSNVRRG